MTVAEMDRIETGNTAVIETLRRDYESLGERLARRGVDIEAIKRKAATFGIAVPSWGVGTGAPASPAFLAPASRAASSTSSKTAR
jgi:L-rhamnose isomerase